jgi:hypothetical protein
MPLELPNLSSQSATFSCKNGISNRKSNMQTVLSLSLDPWLQYKGDFLKCFKETINKNVDLFETNC